VTCLPISDQLDEGISAGETARTANPAQTNGFWGVKKGIPEMP